MIPLSHPTRIIEADKTRGVFEIDALYPGYGVTIGTALRRVLLSSLAGAAVTQVKIKNAPHEFSAIPGVMEDMIQLILNLKQMRFRSFSEEPQTAILSVKGEKEVKGSDFKFPSQVELINKDVPIATLTDKNAELEMEIQIEQGIGYVPAEMLKKGKNEIGTIALDAIFTPIRKVNYSVSNTRVGDRTDYNKVTLEVVTDGSVAPQEAFRQAVEILLKQFEIVLAGVPAPVKSKGKREVGDRETDTDAPEDKPKKKTARAKNTAIAKKKKASS